MTKNLKKATTVLVTAILVIASLISIGMMHTNNAAAAGNVIFKETFKGGTVQTNAETTEGSIMTGAILNAHTDPLEICLSMSMTDANTGESLAEYFGCSPADQVNIANSLNSGTFSGTITLTELNTGQEKTVTVNGDMTANGKPHTSNSLVREVGQGFSFKLSSHGKLYAASGSLTITDTNTGDVILSTEDSSGEIGRTTQGLIEITKK